MKKLYSTIAHLPVISFQSEDTIATCKEYLFDPGELMCKVIKVRRHELFRKVEQFVIWEDVLEFSNGLYIQDQEVLVDADELVRHQQYVDHPCVIINMQVKTETGQELGVVYDFTIDAETGALTKIHITTNSLFITEKHIIDRSQIVKIHENTIIVYDALIQNGLLAQALKKVKKLKVEPSMTTKKP